MALRHGLLGHMDRNETKDVRWAFDYWLLGLVVDSKAHVEAGAG